MVIQTELQKLFTKNMNRKEFLAHVGAALFAVVGISSLIKHLIKFNEESSNSARPVASSSGGYGGASYGGGHKR